MTTLRGLLVLFLVAVLSACGGGDEPTEDSNEASPTESAAAPGEPTGATSTDAATPSTQTNAPEPVDAPATVPLSFVGPGGQQVTFDVELAADAPTRQVGLMNRTEMPADAGMLFLFPADSSGGFWMKNTHIPLQIAFLSAEGEIVDILEMVPCEDDPCPIYTPSGAYRYALEVNSGALDEAGVDESWHVDLPADLPDAS